MISEIIKELVGKKCLVSTGSFGVSYTGDIVAADDKWLKIDTGKKTVVLSLDFITNIEIKD